MSSPFTAPALRRRGAGAEQSPTVRRRPTRSARPAVVTLPLFLAAALSVTPSAFAHGGDGAFAGGVTPNGAKIINSVTTSSGGYTLPDLLDPAEPTKAHQAEHSIDEAFEAKIRRMSLAQRKKLRLRALGETNAKGQPVAKRLQDQNVGPANVYGAWTSGPFPAPTYGISGIMLPTGRVLVMSMGESHGSGRTPANEGQDVNNDGGAAIWDPTKGTGPSSFKFIPPPPVSLDDPKNRTGSSKLRSAPVYCTGHVQLADGRIVVAGGNLDAFNGGFGLKLLFVFDPFTETWVRQKDLINARWYPTLTRLSDGRVIMIAGRDEKGVNRAEVSVYPADGQKIPGIDTNAIDPNAGTTDHGTKAAGLYPHVFELNSGKVALVGPTADDSGILDPSTWKWSNPTGYKGYSGAIGSYPATFLQTGTTAGPDRVFTLGGLNPAGNLQPLVSTIRPELDKTWTNQAPLNLARRNSPAVILPDGTVTVVGGGLKNLRDVDPTTTWPSRRQPEIYDPASGTWKLGPAQKIPRSYHSIALLLPDGRVLSAGDDLQSTLFDNNLNDRYDTTFEIYSPPYLFKGPRPVVTQTPARATYAQPLTFTVQGDANDIARVTMVAPASTTHGLDMNQRQLDLTILSRSGNQVTVSAPPTAAAAPPGDYMLFALNAIGVPSIGKFVSVLPSGAAGHPSDDSAPVWTSSVDNGTGPKPALVVDPRNPTGPNPMSTTPVVTPTPGATPTPGSTPTPGATPTPTATPTPGPKVAPRPWWWPWPLPWPL